MANIYIAHNDSDTTIACRIICRVLERRYDFTPIVTSHDCSLLGESKQSYFVERAIDNLKLVIIVIGKNWYEQLNSGDHLDSVIIERTQELGIPFIPVLVDDVEMPDKADLPYSLHFVLEKKPVVFNIKNSLEVNRSLLFEEISKEADPENLSRPSYLPFELPRHRRSRTTVYSGESGTVLYNSDNMFSEKENVHLGVAVPSEVALGEYFVARFAAYTDSAKDLVERALQLEAPSSQLRLDLDTCRWQLDTLVTVHVQVSGATVENPTQTFLWQESSKILRFDVTVDEKTKVKTLILRFNIVVEGIPIAALRPEINVVFQKESPFTTTEVHHHKAPQTAFASYSTRDRLDVMGRVRSLYIATGIEVFIDRVSLKPSDNWKRRLLIEIIDRDLFLLFWSRRAMLSEWVEWEWRTALEHKSLDSIQPHPLEPIELAPAPEELSDLQFGNMYEAYLTQLREAILPDRKSGLKE